MKTIIPWALLVITIIASAVSGSGKNAELQKLETEITKLHSENENLTASLKTSQTALKDNKKKLTASRSQVESLAESLETALSIKRKDTTRTAPSGHFLNGFNKGINDWTVPPWASGRIRHSKQPDKLRRGSGALGVGYLYGQKDMAVMGPIVMSGFGGLKRVRLYAKTTAMNVQLAIGVVESSGARYEIKTPGIRPKDNWRLLTVSTDVLHPVKGITDSNETLDVDKIVSIYVADRSPHTEGGNVIFIDDIAVDLYAKN